MWKKESNKFKEVKFLLNSEQNLPLRIQKEEALLKRLLKNHLKYFAISQSIETRKAGHRGELNVDYHLSFLPKHKYEILKGLHLQNGPYKFQIDKLLLSPNFILDIEVKNLKGTLFFDKFSKQLLQRYDDIEKGYPNPIQQAERQILNLKEWLTQRKFPSIPLCYLVAIGFPQTIIKSDDNSIFQKVLHAEHLVTKIENLEITHKIPLLDDKTLRKIKRTLLKENSPPEINILEKWDISPSEVLTGVFCPFCQYLPMLRMHSRWYCPNCKSESKDAHFQAIHDYFLIMKSTISNKECRDFLHLPTRTTAAYLLKNMNLTQTGTTKGIVYHP